MALVAEMLRQSVRDLTLLGWTLGIETELLLSQPEVVSTIRSPYTGLDLFGMAPAFRWAVETGTLEVVEETETTMGLGLRAALQGVGYMPGRTLIGTDIMNIRPDIAIVTCPYTGNRYPAIPAVYPDVALIHVALSDMEGNAVIETNRGVDRELALLARYTVVTAEEIAPSSDPRLQNSALIGHSVDALVHCPGGAWPTSCYPNYTLDAMAMLDYVEAWNHGGEMVASVLNRWVDRLRKEVTP